MMSREATYYLLVGGACAAGQNMTIIALAWSGYPYLLVNLASAVVFVPLGYVLHSRFTFRVAISLSGLIRFVAGVLAGLPLSSALLWTSHGLCKLPIEIASPLVTLLMALYGFAVARSVLRRSSWNGLGEQHQQSFFRLRASSGRPDSATRPLRP